MNPALAYAQPMNEALSWLVASGYAALWLVASAICIALVELVSRYRSTRTNRRARRTSPPAGAHRRPAFSPEYSEDEAAIEACIARYFPEAERPAKRPSPGYIGDDGSTFRLNPEARPRPLHPAEPLFAVGSEQGRGHAER